MNTLSPPEPDSPRSMTLLELLRPDADPALPHQVRQALAAVSPEQLTRGSGDLRITDIVVDSRAATPGALFVCASGYPADRHNFVAQAAQNGAVAVVVEAGREATVPAGLAVVSVPDTRAALAALSVTFWHHPSRDLRLYGVTGTNGKTTSAFLLAQILRARGDSVGVIGTLGAFVNDENVPGSDRTTPEVNDLQRLLRRMADGGVRSVAMEVSSHALALGRVALCRFAGAIFTNLTQDHLDFHGSLDAYYAAKRRLLTEYATLWDKRDFHAAINLDDAAGRRLAGDAEQFNPDDWPAQNVTFGASGDAVVQASCIALLPTGSAFRVTSPWGAGDVSLPLVGRFNVSNALGVAALALASGVPASTVTTALSEARGVPGRFESVREGQPFGVVVDYAHTPDGLENVLTAARDMTAGRVVCVFGCGGDRDPGKRPLMGKIAGDLADVAYVTSDNPRSEDPNAIIAHILDGITETTSARVEVEPNRRAAIFQAIAEARPGDLVLIAGKGHETYQLVGDRTLHFDDREVAREAIHATF